MTTPAYLELNREAVPSGSFVYGQPARIRSLAAPLDRWLVGTDCAHENDDGTFSTVICVHFVYRDEAEARDAADGLARHHRVALIRPAS